MCGNILCSIKVRNFYSVSISGYHIAEAELPIRFRNWHLLVQWFSFVEYYLLVACTYDDFCRIYLFSFQWHWPWICCDWPCCPKNLGKRMKYLYKGNDRSRNKNPSKLRKKFARAGNWFNDIRHCKALYAIYDNCNSLHQYTMKPSPHPEESVRRAMAIQLIINKELGFGKKWKSIYRVLYYWRIDGFGRRNGLCWVWPN